MQKSRQFSFINNKHGFTISFLNGSPVIDSLQEIHNIGPHAISFYNKTVLSSLQMVNFLKPGESLGFYIDSEEPYFRYKIEMGHSGSFRTLLLPEDFEDFPTHLTGNVRIHKFFPNNQPYTSVLDFKNHLLEDLVNEVMDKSYQTLSRVFTSDDLTNTLMVTKLPPSNVNKKVDEYEEMTLEKITNQYKDIFEDILNLKTNEIQDIVEFCEGKEFNYLGSKEIEFHCPCSKERMIENLFTLSVADREDLFTEKETVETRCDYCNTIYSIEKKDILIDLQ